jgi:hypothetical protein
VKFVKTSPINYAYASGKGNEELHVQIANKPGSLQFKAEVQLCLITDPHLFSLLSTFKALNHKDYRV